MQVLVDIGNTRIKWAEVEDGRLANVGNAVHRDSRERALASFAAALPKRVTRVIVANVAGAGRSDGSSPSCYTSARESRPSSSWSEPSSSACAARTPILRGSGSTAGSRCSPRTIARQAPPVRSTRVRR